MRDILIMITLIGFTAIGFTFIPAVHSYIMISLCVMFVAAIYLWLFFKNKADAKNAKEKFFYAGLKNGMFISQGEDGDMLSLPDLSPPKLFRDESVCKKAIADLLTEKGQVIFVYSILTYPNITPWRFWANK